MQLLLWTWLKLKIWFLTDFPLKIKISFDGKEHLQIPVVSMCSTLCLYFWNLTVRNPLFEFYFFPPPSGLLEASSDSQWRNPQLWDPHAWPTHRHRWEPLIQAEPPGDQSGALHELLDHGDSLHWRGWLPRRLHGEFAYQSDHTSDSSSECQSLVRDPHQRILYCHLLAATAEAQWSPSEVSWDWESSLLLLT